MRDLESEREHLAEEDIAAYLDRTLGPDRRDAVDSHLADCADCRAEIRSAARQLRSQKSRRWWTWGPPALAAAALAVLLVANPFATQDPTTVTQRAPETPSDVGERIVMVVTPEDGVSLERNALTFVWRPVDSGARYHFTLTNAFGEDVWSTDTTDTLLVVPPDVSLVTSESYLWYVDALLLDGHSLTTGTRRFELIP